MNRKKRRWENLLAAPLLTLILLAVTFLPVGNVQAAETADAYRCSITIPMQVNVTGDTAPQENYTFTIEAETAGATLPADQSLVITGSGSASFGTIEYTEPDDYVYRIRQTAGQTKGMTYDSASYQVTVRVVNAGNGTLAAEIWAVKNDSNQKVDSISFNNQYDNGQAPAVTPTAPGSGADNNVDNNAGNTVDTGRGNDGKSGGDTGSGTGSDRAGRSDRNSSSDPGSSGSSSSSRAAKTGDTSQIYLYSGLMAASLLCCALFLLAGRRKRRKSA